MGTTTDRQAPVTQLTEAAQASPAAPARRAAVFGRAGTQPKPWGHEVLFALVDGCYAGKLITVHAGRCLSCQFHREKDETLYVVSGQGVVEHGPDAERLEAVVVRAGDTVHVPAGVVHRVAATTELVVAECSTAAPGWREDVVRLSDAYGRAGTTVP